MALVGGARADTGEINGLTEGSIAGGSRGINIGNAIKGRWIIDGIDRQIKPGAGVGDSITDGEPDSHGAVLICSRSDGERAVGAKAADDNVAAGDEGLIGGESRYVEEERAGINVIDRHWNGDGRVFRGGLIGDSSDGRSIVHGIDCDRKSAAGLEGAIADRDGDERAAVGIGHRGERQSAAVARTIVIDRRIGNQRRIARKGDQAQRLALIGCAGADPA